MKKFFLSFIVISILFYACKPGKSAEDLAKEEAAKVDSTLLATSQGLFKILPEVALNEANAMSDAKIKLGKILYFDKKLSLKETQSCNTCHNLETYGVDNNPTSAGDNGGFGNRNSPTTLNAALHATQFWDGRMKDVEEQAGGPILNPVEMAIPNEKFLIDRLSKVEIYQNLFKEAFPEDSNPLTYKNIQNAIGAFERTLITPNKFDKYLAGDLTALSIDEKKGLQTFINTGCASCHNGEVLGGNMFQKFGVFAKYEDYTKSKIVDNGRFDVTKNEADKFFFKVSGLRNIEKTAPYFHDGSVASLEESIKIMAKVELNKDLTDVEIAEIATFLKALTANLDAEKIKAPVEL